MLAVTLFSIELLASEIPIEMPSPPLPKPMPTAREAATAFESILALSVATTEIPFAVIPPAVAIDPTPSMFARISVNVRFSA